jgi:hypothetical protein
VTIRPVLQLLVAALILGCEPPAPQSQFGEYRPPFKHLRFGSGDSVTVYRVKYWTFSSGESPALQLEYEPPVPVSDTAALRSFAREVWPLFEPYVDSLHLTNAILTATHLQVYKGGQAQVSRTQSFGFTANRDTMGVWRLTDDPRPLPAPESHGAIFEANGVPFANQFPGK